MTSKQGVSPKMKHANGPRKATVAKAGARSGSSQRKRRDYIVRQDQTYSHGRAGDVLKERGEAMLDILLDVMQSPSSAAMDNLRFSTIAYVEKMAEINWRRGEHPMKRHSEAMKVALEGLNSSERAYASRQIEMAFRATRPRH